jgi:hypothetical protein
MDWTCPDCRQRFAARNASHSCAVQDPEAFFAPYPHGLPLLARLRKVLQSFGPVEVNATKTQVSFRARRRFAWLWVPQMALKRGPPDVFLAFGLPYRAASRRIKESVEVRAGLWVHHLRLGSADDLDDEVQGWLRESYEAAKGEGKGV